VGCLNGGPLSLASRLDLAQGGRAPMTDYCSPPKPGLDGLFDCNICLETASEPIVTLCGHLYCWGCIYKWLEMRECPACPICKAAISRERMLPIYGRGRPHVDPRSCTSVSESSSIPTRPPAASRAYVAAPAGEGAVGGSSTAAVAASALSSAAATAESGFDVMASLFGLRVVYQVASHPAQARGALSSEEQQQAILSRLLLLLGAFVMVCLLMF
jgi:E3 ubiquitin-protein ligase RNF5